MEINVEYKDADGRLSNIEYSLSRLEFAKHFAIAGQRYAPEPQKLFRTIAMFVHYTLYLQKQEFYNNRFSEPPAQLSDPTEKAQFSNLAGRAIADFLSKRINGSLYTVNYEAAMRMHGMQVKGKRPDLLAFTENSQFAIEAKGFSKSVRGNMNSHKNQSKTGGIPVNFTVACVSYDLYRNVKTKYHDPTNYEVPYDNELLRRLTRNYYKGLSEFLNEELFNYEEVAIQDEKFYEVGLLNEKDLDNFFNSSPFWNSGLYEIFYNYKPKLILPKGIMEYAEKGISNGIKPFFLDTDHKQKQKLYIDNDRIGLKIECK